LEDVSIYKQQIQDIKHIEETLKREEPIVKFSESLINNGGTCVEDSKLQEEL